MPTKLFTKGQTPWNKGRAMPIEERKKLSQTLKDRGIRPTVHFSAKDEKHPLWKGGDVSYSGLHYWLSRRLGKPKVCDHCGTITAKKYEWANISGKYRREVTDWKRLCVRCHRIFDKHPWFNRLFRK